MYLSESYKSRIKELAGVKNFSNNSIVCYHRSDSLEHMENNQFSLEFSNSEDSIFGRALYFAQSPNISNQLGKYLCKFKIKLDKPILNLNKEIAPMEANKLLSLFNNKFNTKIDYYNKDLVENVQHYDFSEDYDTVQYGEFFLEVQYILKKKTK